MHPKMNLIHAMKCVRPSNRVWASTGTAAPRPVPRAPAAPIPNGCISPQPGLRQHQSRGEVPFDSLTPPPWVAKLDMVQRPVALLGEVHKRVLHDAHAKGSRNFKGRVGAARVENDDIVAPPDRFDAGRQVVLFVAGQD